VRRPEYRHRLVKVLPSSKLPMVRAFSVAVEAVLAIEAWRRAALPETPSASRQADPARIERPVTADGAVRRGRGVANSGCPKAGSSPELRRPGTHARQASEVDGEALRGAIRSTAQSQRGILELRHRGQYAF